MSTAGTTGTGKRPKTERGTVPGEVVESVLTSLLVPSPFQKFERLADSEMVQSIQATGVQVPILARMNAESKYEIVFGHRRFDGAMKAGMSTVSVIVRNLTDEEAQLAQITENLQREGLNPIQEGELFLQFREVKKTDNVEIASVCGCSEKYVRDRISLLGLPPLAKEALLNEGIGYGVAYLIVKLPEQYRQEATDIILSRDWARRSLREATNAIESNLLRRLDGASFDLNQADIAPGCPACTNCVFRSSIGAADLFEPNDRDRCMNGECFNAKRNAVWEQTSASFASKGVKVIDDESAVAGGLGAYGDGQFLDISAEVHLPGGKTLKVLSLLSGDQKKQVAVVRAFGDKPVKVIDRETGMKLLKEAGFSKGGSNLTKSPEQKEQDRIRLTLNKRVIEESLEKLRGTFTLGKLPKGAVLFLCKLLVNQTWSDTVKRVASSRGLLSNKEPKSQAGEFLIQSIEETGSDLAAFSLMAELLLVREGYEGEYPLASDKTVERDEFATLLGVDVKKLRAEVTGVEVPAEKVSKPEKTKTPTATKSVAGKSDKKGGEKKMGTKNAKDSAKPAKVADSTSSVKNSKPAPAAKPSGSSVPPKKTGGKKAGSK